MIKMNSKKKQKKKRLNKMIWTYLILGIVGFVALWFAGKKAGDYFVGLFPPLGIHPFGILQPIFQIGGVLILIGFIALGAGIIKL